MKPIKAQTCPCSFRPCGWDMACFRLVVLQFIILVWITALVQGQTFTVLHEFTGTGDGEEPFGGVILDQENNLYGTTSKGGAFDRGTVFEIDAHGKEKGLHSFWGSDGLSPEAGLTLDSSGNLYGTTILGGTPKGGNCIHGCGAVFKLNPHGKESVLYAFTGQADGGNPEAAVIRNSDGTFYGATSEGGDLSGSCLYESQWGGCGVIYKVTPADTETILYTFTGGVDGDSPTGLLMDDAGNLYGTTHDGGTYGKGAIYELDESGNFTILYSFTGGADGDDPIGVFVRDSSGNLYGLSYDGGRGARGVVFKLDTSGKLNVLHSFAGGSDGAYPEVLITDGAGNFYGATSGGGKGCSCGTVFKLTASGHETTLHSFTGRDGKYANGLIMDPLGTLYGTTLGGGKQGPKECANNQGCGVVFKLTP